MNTSPEKQQEAVAALAGAARMRKRIWITDDKKAQPFCDVTANASIPVQPVQFLSTFKARAQNGDVLIISAQSSMSEQWIAAAHALHVRCLLPCALMSNDAFDLPWGEGLADFKALDEHLTKADIQPQRQKIFTDWQQLRGATSGLRPLVFTNGVFDILHRGHIHSLQAARDEGAYLVVGVNSDASVRRLGKGADRPIQPEEDRAALLAALSCVDFVTVFTEDTPASLIATICPDVLVKGGDYQPDQIAGADFVKRHGGKVVTIAFEHNRSTTQILRKIRGHD